MKLAERPNRHRPHERRRAAQLLLNEDGERRVRAITRRNQKIAHKALKAYPLDRARRKKNPKGGIVKAHQIGDLRGAEFAARVQFGFTRLSRKFIPRAD